MTLIPCSSSWLITLGWAHPLGTAPPDCAAYEPQITPGSRVEQCAEIAERIAARAAARSKR